MNFNCKQCGHQQEVPDKYAGKTVKCPNCKASVKIPEKIEGGINRYSLSQFINQTGQKDKGKVSFKTFLGRGSGESIQMRFQGDGFVVIQPYEEVYLQSSG